MKEPPNARERLRAAFTGPPPVGLRAIAPHACPECDALAKDLNGRSFGEVAPDALARHADALPLLSPEAFRHYLPAWLLYGLDHPDDAVMEMAIYHLTPSPALRLDSGDYWEARFGVLSPEERAAIGAFFAEVIDYQLFPEGEDELARARELWLPPDERRE